MWGEDSSSPARLCVRSSSVRETRDRQATRTQHKPGQRVSSEPRFKDKSVAEELSIRKHPPRFEEPDRRSTKKCEAIQVLGFGNSVPDFSGYPKRAQNRQNRQSLWGLLATHPHENRILDLYTKMKYSLGWSYELHRIDVKISACKCIVLSRAYQ